MKEQKQMDKTSIPSIQELHDVYEQELRKIAQKSIQKEDDKVVGKQGAFFKNFRREEPLSADKELEILENIYYKEYREYVQNQLKYKEEKIKEIENLIEYHKFFLRWERRVNIKASGRSHYGSNAATRYRADNINELQEKLEALLEESPEAWDYYHKRKLLQDIETQHRQRLVDVPYVARAKKKITDSLELGVPVYIVGHLGSGKTQLATEAALQFSIQNKVQFELESELTAWFEENPSADESQAIKKFKQLNRKKTEYYNNLLQHGTKKEMEDLQPFFISGSHNLTYEDMFVEKTLTLEHSFSHKSYSEYLNMIIGDFYEWMDEHKEKLQEMTEEEQLQLKIQIWKSFSDLLVASNSAFGTEIRKTEKEVLKAVKQGKPVIVDELNTIAMQNLIALNDILQRHAGSTAYITGVGPVTIKPGFAFIGTGNLSTQMVSYEGTNVLNPAFKSRFVTLEYNYVAQNTKGLLQEQQYPEQNELFRIIIARLAESDGNIWLPNPQKTLEELFRFSQLSRVTQNIFMGKWEENEQGDSFSGSNLELRESVLSIRNILHVLDNWNLGEQKDLSQALWDGFISSITYPDDQNYILAQAVRFGFFPESEGWSVKAKAIGAASTTYDEIRTRPYRYVRPEIEVLSYMDVVHILYGEGVQRKNLPEKLQQKFSLKAKTENTVSIEKYQQLDEKLSHLEHSKLLLEQMEDKEGDK